MNVHDFSVNDSNGIPTVLSQYRNQVLLIVNVASKCGFTPQYAGLEALHRKYQERGFSVLGFPCNQFLAQEPGDDAAIKEFCKLKYDVSFPLFAKIDVNGSNASPLYQYLKTTCRGTLWTTAIKWNFTKFLVNRNGIPVRRSSTLRPPSTLAAGIEKLLA